MNSRGSEGSFVASDAQDPDDQMQEYDEEDREENGETSDSEDDEDGEDVEGNTDTRTSELEKFARASASGMENALEDYLGPAGEGALGKKRERSNAKAVECLDMDGNLVELFRSGMAASMKLGIPQGDISLCCRGLKPSVMGYKFRFYGETEEKQALRLKKGFVLEGVGMDSNQAKPEMTRTTRASRGEYGQGVRQMELQSRNILDPPELKSRKWHLEKVKSGPFLVNKWIPSAATPTPELQSRLPKNALEAKLNKNKRRRMVNRLSIGSNVQSKYVYDDPV